MKKIKLFLQMLLVVAVVVVVFVLVSDTSTQPSVSHLKNDGKEEKAIESFGKLKKRAEKEKPEDFIRKEIKDEAPVKDGNMVLVADEQSQEEELVNQFDALTDKWIKKSKENISMKEVEKFCSAFKKIPKSRKNECIQRALNLIPDSNAMLLAGILMDKSIEKEILQTVFGDVLNRSDNVKKTILKHIFEDKTHPCWADAAWILDVTGGLPKNK